MTKNLTHTFTEQFWSVKKSCIRLKTENWKVTERTKAKYYDWSLVTILANKLGLTYLDLATETAWIYDSYLHIWYTKLC